MLWFSTYSDTKGKWERITYDYFSRPLSIYGQTMSGETRVRREYDSAGNLSRASAPCFSSACTSIYGGNIFWTNYTYDLLGRRTQASRPESDAVGAPTQASYTYYEGLSTREVDALGKSSTEVVNVAGSLARTVDYDGYAVSLDYEAFGNVARVQDSLGVTLQTASYSARGLKLSASDADRGSWSFGYDALGELTSQTDAKSQTSTFSYDLLGRMTSRVEPEGAGSITSTWTWGSSAAAKNIGQLEWMQVAGTAVSTYRETYSYDNKGRVAQTEYAAAGASAFVNLTYDSNCNAPATVQYPASTSGYRLTVTYTYSNCTQRTLSADGLYWALYASDPFGNPTSAMRGTSNIMTARTFDAVTGRLKTIQSGVGGGSGLQNSGYLYDREGNVIQRQDNNQSLTESFYYDNLHRLDYSTLKVGAGSPTTNLDLSYTPNGNIASKSGVGAYTYDPAKVHAVTSINTGGGTLNYAYDADGNMTSRNGTTLTWYASNYPKAIVQDASNSSYFEYTPDRRRWTHEYKTAGTTYSHVYLGNYVEKVTSGGVTDWKHYIFANGKAVALYIRSSSGTNTTRYVLNDHLGSGDVMTDEAGVLVLRESFDAYGKRRGTAWSGNPTAGELSTMNATTRRGFTMHEHLDSTALIHMNGRVFDPALGRFVSADPKSDLDQEADGPNEYAYVVNRPLARTDPSGFMSVDLEALTLSSLIDSMGECNGDQICGPRPPKPFGWDTPTLDVRVTGPYDVLVTPAEEFNDSWGSRLGDKLCLAGDHFSDSVQGIAATTTTVLGVGGAIAGGLWGLGFETAAGAHGAISGLFAVDGLYSGAMAGAAVGLGTAGFIVTVGVVGGYVAYDRWCD